jgi:hypothetical protein
MARIALESIAARWRKFDRETATVGAGREYVIILADPVLDTDYGVGCEPSLDERIDLNITCENYVMLRGVDWSSPR